MENAEIIRWIFTGLMGVVMFFWQRSMSANDHTIELLKNDIQSLKDTRLHKDDFKEFKIELRQNFDEIKQMIRDKSAT